MRIAIWILGVCAAGTIILSAPLHSSAQEAGIIEGIRGNAYWKKDAHSQEVKLDPKRDKSRLLRAGERIRCDRGGELRLRLYSRPVKWVSPSWFPIPYVTGDKMDSRRQVLVDYGKRGGGDRGATSVYAPSSHSTARPATFEIRWIPKPGLRVLTLIIREESPSGREILRENVAAGMSGLIVSEAARNAITKYRAERALGPLLLILLGAREEIDRVTFFLLSARDEHSLDQELMFWDKVPEGLWRRLGRAHAFTVREMFTEAAEEYEAALKYAPEGTDLLRRTITAHKRTGNVVREEELSRRLPKGTKLSHLENRRM